MVTMKFWARALGCALAVVLIAGPAWAGWCWIDSTGGALFLGVSGPGEDPLFPIVGSYAPPPGSPCYRSGRHPVQGVARVYWPDVSVGLTIYGENDPGCGTVVGEILFNFTTYEGRGTFRSAPYFDVPVAVTFTIARPPIPGACVP